MPHSSLLADTTDLLSNKQLFHYHPVKHLAETDATNQKEMLFSLKATLTITYNSATPHSAPKQARLPVKLRPHHKSQPHLLVDHMEKALSHEIQAMQRGVREKKRQERDAKPTDSAKVSVEKAEAATAESDTDKSAIKYHYSWEKVSLSDVQLTDLQAMDLTGLSAALLEHPNGPGVEYTEQDREILRGLLERKVSRRQQKK
jgi:hypothetical protein